MDGHHLRVHGQRRVDNVTAAAGGGAGTGHGGLEGREGGLAVVSCVFLVVVLVLLLLLLLLRLRRLVLLLMLLPRLGLLALMDRRRAVVGGAAASQLPGLESPAVEAAAVIVEALADHLAAADNDAAVAIVQGGLAGLLEAQREEVVRARRHLVFAVSGLLVGFVCGVIGRGGAYVVSRS